MADPDVQVVLCLTPPDYHAEVMLQAIAAGKHVYTEKPLATSVDDARWVLDPGLVRRRARRLGAGHVPGRRDPDGQAGDRRRRDRRPRRRPDPPAGRPAREVASLPRVPVRRALRPADGPRAVRRRHRDRALRAGRERHRARDDAAHGGRHARRRRVPDRRADPRRRRARPRERRPDHDHDDRRRQRPGAPRRRGPRPRRLAARRRPEHVRRPGDPRPPRRARRDAPARLAVEATTRAGSACRTSVSPSATAPRSAPAARKACRSSRRCWRCATTR